MAWRVSGLAGGSIESDRRNEFLRVTLLVLAGAALYTWHTAPTVRFWDAAERALVARELGVSHPAGCILHAVFGKAFLTIVPLAPDYAANLLSAVAAALALGVSYGIGRRFSDNRALCFGATLVLATSALYWSQAIYSEVYALHFLFFAVFMLFYVEWLARGRSRDLAVAAFVYALGLGVHMSHILLAPWILGGVLLKDRSLFRSPRRLLAVTGAMLLGLSWVAAVVIRGHSYWIIGTTERPDSLERLWAFLTGAQFAWARHPPVALFAKRVIGSFVLLGYSFLGVGAVAAFAGWVTSLRRLAPLAFLAVGGTLSYILYFSDNSTSDVGTLILPCCLFILLYLIIGGDRWATSPARRRVVAVALPVLAAVQAAVFPPLGRAAERAARDIAEAGFTLDEGPPAAFFWEGVLKAKVSWRNDWLPLGTAWKLAGQLDSVPGPKDFVAHWSLYTVLVFYQSSDGLLKDTRLYESIGQTRFYRPETGAEPERVCVWDVLNRKGEGRALFFLCVERKPGLQQPHELVGRYWFDQTFYYLFRIDVDLGRERLDQPARHRNQPGL